MSIEIRTTAKRRWFWSAALVCGAVVVAMGAVALSRGNSEVELAEVAIDDVELTVPGRATLVPEHVRTLIAEGGGTVTTVEAIAGRSVAAGDVLAQIDNPAIEIEVLRATQEVASVVAEHEALALRLSTDRQQRVLAAVRAEHAHHIAELQFNAQQALREKGVSSAIDVEKAKAELSQRRAELEFETKRVTDGDRADAAQLQSSQLRVDLARRDLALAEAKRAALTIKAPIDGLVRSVTVRPGQRIPPESPVAEVISRGFEASISVTEGASQSVRENQPVAIQGRGLKVRANTISVAASSEDGMVEVRAALLDTVPNGIKAQATFNARIATGRIDDAVVVRRPPGAREGESGFVYLVDGSGRKATRTPVQFGGATQDRIVIVSGLKKGDRIALIDESVPSINL